MPSFRCPRECRATGLDCDPPTCGVALVKLVVPKPPMVRDRLNLLRVRKEVA